MIIADENLSRAELEPAHIQFIEHTFHEWLGPDSHARLNGERNSILRWVHRRLFDEYATIATVRVELSNRLRGTRLFAVTSGKGGAGKTTFSVNLAVTFAQQGLRTLLFDADLGMANVHIFAGINPAATLLDVIDRHASLTSVIVPGPGGIHVICGASGVGRLADLSPHVLEAVGRELLRVAANFDVLVMDTGAGISSVVMQFLGLAQDTVVVATPNLAATLDAYGVIKLARENRFKTRLHLVINQADEENQAARVQERVADCAKRFLQAPVSNLGFLLRDAAVEQANQSRRPLVLAQPAHFNSQRISQIAASLLHAGEEPHAESFPSRFTT